MLPRAFTGALLLGLLAPGTAARGACPLDEGLPAAAVVRLTGKDWYEAARSLARGNQEHLARIDALLRSGAFGPPRAAEARRQAHLMARLSLLNVYAYVFRYAEDRERVHEADAHALSAVFASFCEPAIFPLARLQRVRMGRSHVCARYDLGAPGAGQTVLGGHGLRYVIRDQWIEGQRRRVMAVEWRSGSVGSTVILLADHYCFAVSRSRSDGPPGPYELYSAHDLHGAWVRRFGVHRPAAFMFWTSPLDTASGRLPRVPLVGIRIYVPSLRFELPSILPDIDLDDLRTLDLPLPLVEVAYLRQGRQPAWLPLEGDLDIRDWRGVGPVPPGVRARFPNR
jgi:hypothetical protein